MAKSLEILIVPTGPDALTLDVKGRVDGETSPQFDKLVKPLTERQNLKLIINMAACNYVSSAGLSSFFDLRKKVQARQGVVSFCKLQPQIRKVFDIVKALPLECVFSSAAEADAYLDRMMAEELKKNPPQK